MTIRFALADVSVAVAAVATMAVALASSAYSGGVQSLRADFGSSRELLIAGVSLFVVGFAFGPLLWAPLSEIYGRRRIFIISYTFLTLWQAVTCASQNIQSVLVFRFLAGFFGSSPLANAGGTITDVLDANSRGLGMALFAAAPFLGPSLGPITGGFLGEAAGWRWVEGYLAIFSGVLTIVILFLGAETYAPYLLRRRAAKLSKVTGKVYRYRADAQKALDPKALFKSSLIRPWKFLFTEPIVIILTIYTALIYGVLYLNFAAYPIVFQQGRGWSTGIGGLAFLGILVGTIISVVVSVFYINPQYVKVAKKRGGRATPEDRLPPAIWGGFLIVIGLAGFAATNGPNVHWIAPIIFGVPFGLGVIVVFLAVMGYLIDSYTIYAASVLAANAVLRSLFGAAFPLFTAQMYEALGIHWAAALPGFIALACIPFIVVFWKYGARIRAKCKYSADAERQMNAMIAARMAAMQQSKDEESAVQGRETRAASEATVASGTPVAQVNGKRVPPAPETAETTGVPIHERYGATAEEFAMYEMLADRDEVDLSDDERVRLQGMHEKFDYARAK